MAGSVIQATGRWSLRIALGQESFLEATGALMAAAPILFVLYSVNLVTEQFWFAEKFFGEKRNIVSVKNGKLFRNLKSL